MFYEISFNGVVLFWGVYGKRRGLSSQISVKALSHCSFFGQSVWKMSLLWLEVVWNLILRYAFMGILEVVWPLREKFRFYVDIKGCVTFLNTNLGFRVIFWACVTLESANSGFKLYFLYFSLFNHTRRTLACSGLFHIHRNISHGYCLVLSDLPESERINFWCIFPHSASIQIATLIPK